MSNFKLKKGIGKPKLRASRKIIDSIKLTIEGKTLVLYVGTDPSYPLVCELYMKNEEANVLKQDWYGSIKDLLPEQHGRTHFNYCYKGYKTDNADAKTDAYTTMGHVLARLLEYEHKSTAKA